MKACVNFASICGKAFLDYASIFSAFFGKTSIFFRFFLKKELLAFSVIFHDCDPDFSPQKDK